MVRLFHRVPQDCWIGLAALLLAAIYWYGADQIRISPLDGNVNAAAMPKALAWALAALAVALMTRALIVGIVASRATRAPGSTSEEGDAAEPHAHLRAAGMLGLGLAYLLALPHLGYLTSIAILIAGVAIYMRMRIDVRFWLIVVGMAVFFYLLFVRFLGIPLPPGFWPALIG